MEIEEYVSHIYSAGPDCVHRNAVRKQPANAMVNIVGYAPRTFYEPRETVSDMEFTLSPDTNRVSPLFVNPAESL